MEYFPRIQHVAAQRPSQKFTVQIGRNTTKIHRMNFIYVDVQQQSGTPSVKTVHKESGTKIAERMLL